jgi:flavin-dependent dehydrogenase
VAILGGGPAGAFCALWLCRLAPQAGRDLEVVVFDHKSFEKPGPAGCNMCAGVIPTSLVANMSSLGVGFPERVIQRRIQGVHLETRGGSVDIPAPQDAPLYATFRGPGPFGMYPAAQDGFDWHLLTEAQRRGAVHESRLVTGLTMPAEEGGKYQVICRDGFSMEADIVVGAFGVNSNLTVVFERLGFGYRTPATLRARQAEMPVDPEFLRDRMLVFAMGWPRIRYAAITPKRRHVTVTLIGDDPTREDLAAFLRDSTVMKHFPPGWSPPDQYCSCSPRLPVTAAGNPVSDRLVVIGDAHTSRYLKNGIESSFNTAMWASAAIASGHTSVRDLRERYVEPCRETYIRDNAYGRVLLKVHDTISRSLTIARTHMDVATREQTDADRPKLLTDVLWGTFTGSMPYRTILRKAADPRLQARLAGGLLRLVRARMRPSPRPAEASRAGPTRAPGRPPRVIIVGGGPAGAACAITLARGGGRSGAAPEVVLVEAKRFGEHHNQCAGVLSPPGAELVAGVLGDRLPSAILQRRIKGYVLHGESCAIYLDGETFGESPHVLRRVELGALLLKRAEDCGLRVVNARATDLEFGDGGVVVYTEAGSFHGDGVVGAFALDEGTAQVFSRRTRYRRPAHLETLACKIHPGGLDFVPDLLDECIHVFLPKRSSIDFGALIPKGNHIVVIIAGARVGVDDMEEFRTLPEVAKLVPPQAKTDGLFKGAFPLGPAQGVCGGSYVVIGDAAGMVRPFKGKGINSAIEAGTKCAQTILTHGVSVGAFSAFTRTRQHLTGDVRYGRFVRRLVMLMSRHGWLDPVVEEAKKNEALRRSLFDCVSGKTTYRDVVLRTENLDWIPSALWRCATWRG